MVFPQSSAHPRPQPNRRAARVVAMVAAAVAALLLSVSAATGSASAAAKQNRVGIDARERNVIKRVNEVRVAHGLKPLKLSRAITRAADRHSRRQQQARTLTHQLPGQASPRARLAPFSQRTGEVVYWADRGVRSATIVRAWMDSPGHRAVLLAPEFRRAGMSIRSGRGGLYATLDVAGR